MSNLLTLSYWFNLRPDQLTPLAQKLFIAFFVILIILTIITAILKKKGSLYRGFLKRLYNLMLIWLYAILKSLTKIGLQKKQLAKERELKKYLP